MPPGQFASNVPNTYTFRQVGPELRIEWSFPPTTSRERTFQVEFDAYGALRVYDEGETSFPGPAQQISWIGVDREIADNAPVNEATLRFVLPRPVDPGETFIQGPGSERPEDHTEDGQTWTWMARDLGEGESLEAGLRFERLVAAEAPSWQAASDRREQELAEQEARGAQLSLVFLGLGLLVAVGGSVAALGAWWTRGRDPEAGPVAAFLPDPPDDLPPGVIGALMDERVDQRDIVATLVDLGHRGEGGGGIFGAVRHIGGTDAGMGQCHDQIDAARLEPGQPGAGRGEDVAHPDVAGEVVAIPDLDLRGSEADHADAQAVAAAFGVGHGAGEDGEGRHEGGIARRAFAKPGGNVGRHHRKPGAGQRGAQERQAIVEFVIAEGDRVVAQGIEGGDDGMRAATPARGGGVISQRRALQEITVVEEQRVCRLGPGRRDLARDAVKTKARSRAVGLEILAGQAGMQIGGGDQAQLDMRRGVTRGQGDRPPRKGKGASR